MYENDLFICIFIFFWELVVQHFSIFLGTSSGNSVLMQTKEVWNSRDPERVW
jgi:hypothetical protein